MTHLMQQNQSLKIGSTIKGKQFSYTIQSVLGQGSFGITYLAKTKMKGPLGEISVPIALKEFFAKDFNERNEDGSVREFSLDSIVSKYGKDFQKEAQNLSKLKNAGIVNVLESFEGNGTYYYSMEFIEGETLDKYIKEKGYLSEEEAMASIRSIATSVGVMHSRKMLHLDLKPKNVMRRADGELLLIDFGLSKQYEDNGEPESSTSIGLGTPGYAPIEQSQQSNSREFSPTLDIYALGATLYKMLTGNTPPVSSSIFNDGFPEKLLLERNISRSTIDICRKVMSPGKKDRPQSVAEFIALLDGTAKGDDSEETIVSVADAKSKGAKSDKEKNLTESEKPGKPHKLKVTKEPDKKPFPKWTYGLFAGVAVAVLAAVLLNSPGQVSAPDNVQADSTSVVADAVPETSVASKTSKSASKPETPVKPEAPTDIELKSISLNKTAFELDEGSSATLTVKYNPNNATDKTTTWKSSDASIAKVDVNGKVTALKAGSATIIATCHGKDAYCNVTVKTKESQITPVTTGTHAGHEWVDLGLSVKWATCNVGASSPEDYGSYFAWGETSPKNVYTWENLKYRTEGDSYQKVKFSKYVASSGNGLVDNKNRLDMNDDTAQANWGGSWRMPTRAEQDELMEKCTWTWNTQGGHDGYRVTSKSNGNSVFLPAAGYRYEANLYRAGSNGYYWSSSLSTSINYHAYNLFFGLGNPNWYVSRCRGQSVRPVCP